MDNDELAHIGVLGMHWGRRKSSEASSSRPYKLTKERARLEKKAENLIKKTGQKGTLSAKTLSDKEIKSLLKSPIMKKKIKEYDANRLKQIDKGVATMMVAGLAAYALYPLTPLLKYVGPAAALGARNLTKNIRDKKARDAAAKAAKAILRLPAGKIRTIEGFFK